MIILSEKQLRPELLKSVQSIHPHVEVRMWDPADEASLAEATVFWGNPRRWWEAMICQGRALRWVHTPRAGVDDLLSANWSERGILLSCGKGIVAGPGLAEHALALLFAISRGLRVSISKTQWLNSDEHPSCWEWRGKRLGILGGGGVASALVPIAEAMGMEVEVVRRNPALDFTAMAYPLTELNSPAAAWDAVVVALPSTPETRSLLGEAFFAAVKSGVVVVNVGRGDTIEPLALRKALESGRVRAAGLDVTDPEPLPPEDPLWKMANVMITSHTAGLSDQRTRRNEDLMIENFRRFCQGGQLLNLVNPAGGY